MSRLARTCASHVRASCECERKREPAQNPLQWVCTAPAPPSTIEMCSSLRKLFRRLVMADIQRISVQQAHAKTNATQALLVCAYEDEEKCRMLNLDGSISFASLQSRAASLPKAQEIIFY